MAGIQERGGSYRMPFRCHCKRHTLTLGKVSEHEAKSKLAQVGGSCRGSSPRGEVGDRYVPGTQGTQGEVGDRCPRNPVQCPPTSTWKPTMPRRQKPQGLENWTWDEINSGRKRSKGEKRSRPLTVTLGATKAPDG
jgi:hypothetical protein